MRDQTYLQWLRLMAGRASRGNHVSARTIELGIDQAPRPATPKAARRRPARPALRTMVDPIATLGHPARGRR